MVVGMMRAIVGVGGGGIGIRLPWVIGFPYDDTAGVLSVFMML